MQQAFIQNGAVTVKTVPAPTVQPGTVLVAVVNSCISVGTEMASIRQSNQPLWQRALKRPQQVKQVLHAVVRKGLHETVELVKTKINAAAPTGYSAAGIVIAVADDVADLKIGDRVACAGAQCAFHAEIIRVPRNLVAPIPATVACSHASTVTLGAIALQGVRRLNPTIGETIIVVGLGILGQITVQILKANGINVIALDIDSDRVLLAKENGADYAALANGADIENHILRLTDNIGADGVIITAATSDSTILSHAFHYTRKKGRVVLVGDVGLNINRSDIYVKELDFYISTSYGPGRYDNLYEEQGLDYPIGYVRWTENRNMSAYLHLLADNKISLDNLCQSSFSIRDAPAAYAALKAPHHKPLLVLLNYPNHTQQPIHKIVNPRAPEPHKQQIKIALVGAGDFAKAIHLPNIRKLAHLFHLQAVMSNTGHNAKAIAKQYSANYATTDYNAVLSDPNVDAVLIATRHHLHGTMVLQALLAGKHVFVEKPTVLSLEELQRIDIFYREARHQIVPVLMTGYNRRFAQLLYEIYPLVQERTNPLIINYRMNAGFIASDHWVHRPEGGGRNMGEACHIYDLFNALVQADCTKAQVTSIKPATAYYRHDDNFIATFEYHDGSVASLMYTALGNNHVSKECMDIYFDGKVVTLTDYQTLSITGGVNKSMQLKTQEKGHFAELQAFGNCVQHGLNWPIDLQQQIQTMRMALLVEHELAQSRSNHETIDHHTRLSPFSNA